VKTGGLGDVAGALPQALRAQGIDVRVLLPAYREVLAAACAPRELARFAPAARFPSARLLGATLPSGVPALLLDCPPLFDRDGGTYLDAAGHDWQDNWLRFGQLARIAALLASRESPLPWRPGVLHCNDWQTGLAPAYLHFLGGARAATLMSVHNLSFQGLFPLERRVDLGLPVEAGLEFYGRLSFLKAGLQYADGLCAVSPTYAREIQSAPHGCGLEGLLAERADALHGILNGIDDAAWDPSVDTLIAERYDGRHLERKAANKADLQRRLGLEPAPETMLFGAVSRMTGQKGTDLIAAAAAELVALPAQLAVIGVGEAHLERALEQIARAHPGKVAVRIAFDEAQAHAVEAGADAFLMPSRFEPCGLNQMYSQRYGTPPVAHATGGLLDTIEDGVTGILFREASAGALVAAARRAHALYHDRSAWRKLQQAGMRKDFGWAAPARRYAALYRRLTATSSARARRGA
jgi:starch synthase